MLRSSQCNSSVLPFFSALYGASLDTIGRCLMSQSRRYNSLMPSGNPELKVGATPRELLDCAHGLTAERNKKCFPTFADRVDHLVLGGAELSNAVRAEDTKILP